MNYKARPLQLRDIVNSRWFLYAPLLTIVLLVVLMYSLLVVDHRNVKEIERTTLIGDVLWLEQKLRFQILSDGEQMRQLATELGNSKRIDKFQLQATHFFRNNPDVEYYTWFDNNGSTISSLPAAVPPKTAQMMLQHQPRLPLYNFTPLSAPFKDELGEGHILQFSPIYAHNQHVGTLVIDRNLHRMLHEQVPWWFAEKYRVVIEDDDHVIFAKKTNISDLAVDDNYRLSLEPVAQGLYLYVERYDLRTNRTQHTLLASIILLTVLILYGVWALWRQMKQRLRAEMQLRDEYAFRQSMENSLLVGMRARDLEGRLIYANAAFCRMTGYTAEELLNRAAPMPYWNPDAIEETFMLHNIVMSGNAPLNGFEVEFRRKNGEALQTLIYEAPLIDGNGKHIGWMGSVIDITERKRDSLLAQQQQAQLQFSSRLVAMGEMASTLAHELNQPLAAITAYSTGILNQFASTQFNKQVVADALLKLDRQAKRAGEIIRRVYNFVKKNEPQRNYCHLDKIIEDCLLWLEAEIKKTGAQVTVLIERPLPQVWADRLMLEQVLMNLLKNALAAVQQTDQQQRLVEIEVLPTAATESDEAGMAVSVRDNGVGILAEDVQKIFTTFFTTKTEGMGVGLSICRSIIEAHRGYIHCQCLSEPVAMTEFKFWLPRDDPSLSAEQPEFKPAK